MGSLYTGESPGGRVHRRPQSTSLHRVKPFFLMLCVMLLAAGCDPSGAARHVPGGSGGGVTVPTPRAEAPLMGGALLVTRSGRFAVAADADADALHVVDLKTRQAQRVDLPKGSRPNRLAEDGAGDVRVVLRGTGQVATVSLTTRALQGTQAVCAEPRGIAWDPGRAAVHVACAGGHLVTLPLVGSSQARFVAADLRDVVPTSDGRLLVTTFRDGQLYDVSGEAVVPFARLPDFGLGSIRFRAGVAWRAVPGPDGTVVVTHQRERVGDLAPKEPQTRQVSAYGGTFTVNLTEPCEAGPVVRSAVTVIGADGQVLASTETGGVLPTDVAVEPMTSLAVTANPGNRRVEQVALGRSGLRGCFGPLPASAGREVPEELTGVGFTPAGALVTVSRSPARLRVGGEGPDGFSVALAGLDETAPGNALFHGAAPAGLACASCHPEGTDDGHVWTLGDKPRRTQALHGGVTDSAPFHWQGEHRTLAHLMSDTFVSRMAGPAPDGALVRDLGEWLDGALPAPRPTVTQPPELLTEGRRVFQAAGCAGCHAGTRYTSAGSFDVGTGGSFQVPSLVAARLRAPLMHDGCAKTLADRFRDPACGGDRHGDVSKLSVAEQAALVAFLESL